MASIMDVNLIKFLRKDNFEHLILKMSVFISFSISSFSDIRVHPSHHLTEEYTHSD